MKVRLIAKSQAGSTTDHARQGLGEQQAHAAGDLPRSMKPHLLSSG